MQHTSPVHSRSCQTPACFSALPGCCRKTTTGWTALRSCAAWALPTSRGPASMREHALQPLCMHQHDSVRQPQALSHDSVPAVAAIRRPSCLPACLPACLPPHLPPCLGFRPPECHAAAVHHPQQLLRTVTKRTSCPCAPSSPPPAATPPPAPSLARLSTTQLARRPHWPRSSPASQSCWCCCASQACSRT